MSLRRNNNSGATLVEAAMVLPIFFLLLFAIFDFSTALSQYHALSESLRLTGREVALHGSGSEASCSANAYQAFLVNANHYGIKQSQITTVASSAPFADANGVSGITIHAQVKLSCLACNFIPARFGSMFQFDRSVFYPIEEGVGC